jgi:predicted nuclease with TOPRIM domain
MGWLTLLIKRWVQPELDRTRDLLKKANGQLERVLKDNVGLQNRNEELNVQVNRLKADNQELHRQVELLKQANEMQSNTIDRMEKRQKELMERVESLIARVVNLEVAAGRTPEFPI